VEGTSGRYVPSPFTRRWSQRPWRLPHVGEQRARESTKRVGARRCSAILRKRERRQRCQRLDCSGAVGRRLPRSPPRSKGQTRRGKGSACPAAVRRSVLGCRENTRSPGQPHGAQDSVGQARGESRVAAGNTRGTGARRFVQVAEVGRTHRAPCPPGDRKVCWWIQQGASRKEARSPA